MQARGAAGGAARGLSVPGDVSVTGFDGTAAVAAAALTTVEQPVRAKGEAAGRLLAEIVDGTPPRADILAVGLLVRGSTARPKQEDTCA